MKLNKLYVSLFAVVALFVGWAVFFHYYPIENLVTDIGIENIYLASFLLSVIGGFSSITGTSLYAALIALARGGVNPYVLGLIAGVGIFISDSLFYYLATKMRFLVTSVTTKWERVFRRVWKLIYSLPRWAVFLGIYLYAAIGPIPNDLLLVVLALSGFAYREFALFLLLGDLTMAFLLTTISASSA